MGVDKGRLHELSGLKKSVFDKLVLSMVTLGKEMQKEQVSKPKTTKRTHSFVEVVEAKAAGTDYFYGKLKLSQNLLVPIL
jgi:hypothetical protein